MRLEIHKHGGLQVNMISSTVSESLTTNSTPFQHTYWLYTLYSVWKKKYYCDCSSVLIFLSTPPSSYTAFAQPRQPRTDLQHSNLISHLDVPMAVSEHT